MGNVFVAAKQRVEAASNRQTWLETIHGGNRDKRRVMPNSFYNAVLLEKNEKGIIVIPKEILNARPLYTGTFGLIGAKGRPLRNKTGLQCDFSDTRKTVVVELGKEHAGLIDTLVMCDHGFASDGTPFHQLFNAKTGKPIRTDEEIMEAEVVIMKLNGQIYLFKVQNRKAGMFEKVGDENTYTWIADSEVGGLLRRDGGDFGDGQGVGLVDRPSDRFGVAREAASGSPEKFASLAVQQAEHAPAPEATQKLIPETIEGGVILRGPDEQVQQALRVLRSQSIV